MKRPSLMLRVGSVVTTQKPNNSHHSEKSLQSPRPKEAHDQEHNCHLHSQGCTLWLIMPSCTVLLWGIGRRTFSPNNLNFATVATGWSIMTCCSQCTEDVFLATLTQQPLPTHSTRQLWLPVTSSLPQNEKLKNCHFDTVEEIQCKSQMVLHMLIEWDFQEAVQEWQESWEQFNTAQGDCFEVDGGQFKWDTVFLVVRAISELFDCTWQYENCEKYNSRITFRIN